MILDLRRLYLKRRFGRNPAWRRFYRDLNLEVPVESSTFTVFDLETTGLNPRRDQIVSVGAIKVVRPLSLDLSTSFHRFLKVESLKREAVEVHGITPQDLDALGEPPRRVMEDFMEYASGTILVGFNVEFDRRFLDRYLREIYGIPLPFYRMDVLSLWRRKGGTVLSLLDLADRLGVPATGSHSAIDDAYTTALIFLKLVADLRKEPLKVLPLVL
jgi:DNA polymerase-3 subunit epsilon